MQDVHMKLNAGLPDKSGIQQEEDNFTSNELKHEEETEEILLLEPSCVWH